MKKNTQEVLCTTEELEDSLRDILKVKFNENGFNYDNYDFDYFNSFISAEIFKLGSIEVTENDNIIKLNNQYRSFENKTDLAEYIFSEIIEFENFGMSFEETIS